MGFKDRGNCVLWRAGGFIGRHGRGALCLLMLIIVAGVVFLAGGPDFGRPAFLAQFDRKAPSAPATRADSRTASPGVADPVRGRDQSSSQPGYRAASAPLAAALEALESDASDAVAAADRDSDKEPEKIAAIMGSVLDDGGEPLPNQVVSAQRLNSTTVSGQASAVTDRLGMFSFDALEGGEYLLQVAGDERFHPASLRVRTGTSAAEIYLQRKGRIEVTGRVTDQGQVPLAGVQVRSLGSQGQAVSDEAGRYRIEVEKLRAGAAPVLEFRLAGFRDARERIESTGGPASERLALDVILAERGDTVSVSGWVSGPEGEPVADAGVWLSSSAPPANHRTRTDQYGAYEFKRVEGGEQYRLGVEPGGAEYHRYVSTPQRIGSQHVSHDVRLDKAGQAEFSGVLVDPRGNPLAGFGIWLRQLEAGAPVPVFVQTDSTGQFAPIRVRSGALKLESHSSPQLEAGGIRLEDGESRFMQIPLDWGQAWLTGQVVDERDQPVSQAEVVVQWRFSDFDVTSSSRRAVRADQAGFFSVANLGANAYHLTVSAPGFQTRRLNVSPTFGDEILIPMRAQSSPSGGRQ
jgi:hypothetical protein